MTSFFRWTDGLLLAALVIVCALCAWLALARARFSPEEYESGIARLQTQTEELREKTAAARSGTEEELARLRADLRAGGEEAAALADRLERLRAEEEEKEQRLRLLLPEAALCDDPQGVICEERRQYALKIRELEDAILRGESGVRICYWTLDDGPTRITKNFLDAFDELGEHVHVTFFAANEANSSDDEEEMLRREMMSGHSVQNHSYSHDYWSNGRVYRSAESFREQVLLQEQWLYEVTDFRPGVFRFPGGSQGGVIMRPEAKDILEELGYRWVDWNCNLHDSGSDRLGAAEQIARAMDQIPGERIAVVLGHDWNMATCYAIKTLIPRLEEMGYVFLPLFPESAMMELEVSG